MSDSKGAAIDEKLWDIVDVPTPLIYKQQMVKAFKALLAQEMNKARIDELVELSEHVEVVSKNAKNTLDIIKGFTERIKYRLERLG